MNIFHAIGLFGGSAIFFVLIGVFWTLRNIRRRKEEKLVERMRVVEQEQDVRITRFTYLQRERLMQFRLLGGLGQLLVESGLEISLERFLLLTVSLFMGVFLLVALTTSIGGGLFLGLLAVGVLLVYVKTRFDHRINTIDEQLPKALELMAIGLRAGHTLEDAIRLAAKQIQDPLGGELARVHEEFELGRPITESLSSLATRLSRCQAIHVFVESVLVLKQTGGNLVEIIEQIIDSIRSQANYEIRYRAMTSEGRTSGMIIGGLPLVLLVALMFLNREFLHVLFFDPAGQLVLGLSLVMWLLGIYWVYRLVRPAV